MSNIRLCDHGSNMMNKKIYRNNSSGFKGVSHNKKNGLWLAQIGHRGEIVRIGQFADAKSAAAAYDKEAIALFGEFAKTNKSMGLL